MKITNLLLCLSLLGLSGLSFAEQVGDPSDAKKETADIFRHKSGTRTDRAKLALDHFLEQVEAEMEEEKELVERLTNLSQIKKDINYKKSALEELIQLVESTDGLHDKLPIIKQALGELDTEYQKLDVEFNKKAKKLTSKTKHSYYWAASLFLKEKAESGVAPKDLVASLEDNSHISYIKEIVEIFYNTDEEAIQNTKKSVLLEKYANDFEIPSDVVKRGAISTVSKLLQDALEAKNKYYEEASALDEIIDQVKVLKSMKDRVSPLKKEFKKAKTKFEQYSQLYDQLGAIIKVVAPATFAEINARDLDNLSGNNALTLLNHKPGQITSGEVNALENIFQQADQIKNSEAHIVKYAQEVAQKFGLGNEIDLKGFIKAVVIKSRNKGCAANILPKKTKGNKK